MILPLASSGSFYSRSPLLPLISFLVFLLLLLFFISDFFLFFCCSPICTTKYLRCCRSLVVLNGSTCSASRISSFFTLSLFTHDSSQFTGQYHGFLSLCKGSVFTAKCQYNIVLNTVNFARSLSSLFLTN